MRRLHLLHLRSFVRDGRGTAAVEFALLAPVFLLLLLGMVGYGIYFGASHSVEQIAADAARTAVAGYSEAERKTLVARFVTRNAGGYPFVTAENLSVETHDSAADPSQFVVEVRFDAASLPIWNLCDCLPMPVSTIKRTSTIRLGGM